MKRYRYQPALFLVIALLVYATTAFPACSTNMVISMPQDGSRGFTGFNMTRANTRVMLWVLNSDWQANPTCATAIPPGPGSTNSCLTYDDSSTFFCTGSPTEIMPGCSFGPSGSSLSYSSFGSTWYILHDWVSTAAGGTACPPKSSSYRIVAFFQDSTGGYGLWSVLGSGSGYLLGNATNTYETIRSLPTISITSATPNGGNYDLQITWNAPASADLKGNYDTDPGNLIAGYRLYYRQDVSPTPTQVLAGNWTQVPGTGDYGIVSPGTVSISVPFVNTQYTYLALAPILNVAALNTPLRISYFVGSVKAVTAPTPAGLFTSVRASSQSKQVTANWTTNVESGVVAYDVVYSNKKNGPFQVVPGTTTVPTGNGSSYSKTFARPRGSDKLFLKLKATMTSGVDEYSNLVVVGGGAATK